MSSHVGGHFHLPEPLLSFHPTRKADRDIHPLRGLLAFGPYSSGLIPDPIRVATLAPSGEGAPLYDFLKQLRTSYKGTERKEYLIDWPGFSQVFRVRIEAAGKSCHAELPSDLDERLAGQESPHSYLADALTRAIQTLEAYRSLFDVLFIYLPQKWSVAFTGPEGDDFDLHAYLKALTATRGLPIQIVRDDSAMAYSDKASVMWRIGLALYAKAGGIPWKLSDSDPESAFIGLSYAVRPETSELPRFVTCCSQVFDADGTGLEFVAYDALDVRVERDNPFLSRADMFRVMTRSMDLYRRRHAGRSPRKVTVHKTTEFKAEEVDGAMEGLHLCESVDLIQVVQHVGWRGIRLDSANSDGKPIAAAFPVSRGTVLGTAPYEALLWSHGSVGGIKEGGSYFQGGKGTPQPIRLVRHAGHGTWLESAAAILALSKMNWNNDAMYDFLPVTIGYADILAKVLKRMPSLGSQPYQFRFFM